MLAAPLLISRPFSTFDWRLDSNPASCRSKQARYRPSPAILFLTPFVFGYSNWITNKNVNNRRWKFVICKYERLFTFLHTFLLSFIPFYFPSYLFTFLHTFSHSITLLLNLIISSNILCKTLLKSSPRINFYKKIFFCKMFAFRRRPRRGAWPERRRKSATSSTKSTWRTAIPRLASAGLSPPNKRNPKNIFLLVLLWSF